MAKGRTVKFEFDVFKATGEALPEDGDKESVLEGAAEFLLESVLSSVGNQRSPVAGYGAFPKLSKAYAKRKKAEGAPPVPDLVLSGEMLDSMQTYTRGNKIGIKLTGQQGAKADGHCNLSGDSTLPLRRFIPGEGEQFKADILDGIRRIIRSGG